jgi:hypothetical protein
MRWVRDNSGRFAKRPHYLPDELDSLCETSITSFLVKKYGVPKYPVSTEDLCLLIEGRVQDLDFGCDLEADVEGVTEFYAGEKPVVKISRSLAADPRYENRLRTTLTHELGHVELHAFMFDATITTPDLFGSAGPALSNFCNRDSMYDSKDWMEWQAGYACGAYLMPVTTTRRLVAELRSSRASDRDLIREVSVRFRTSEDASRVRLSKLGLLGRPDYLSYPL